MVRNAETAEQAEAALIVSSAVSAIYALTKAIGNE